MSRLRRNFSPTFKADVALQALRGEKSQTALCREHNLSPDLICRLKLTLEDRPRRCFRALPQATTTRCDWQTWNGSSGS